jgi:hypothetical protein
MPIDRTAFPCWQCPEGADARFWLGNNAPEDIPAGLSPHGWPPGCCHVRIVAQTARPDVAAVRAAEGQKR